MTEFASDLSEDEALLLDAFVRHAHENGLDAQLSIASLLESTELPRAALIEAMELLEAEGHVTVVWNLNGMFHAQLTELGWTRALAVTGTATG